MDRLKTIAGMIRTGMILADIGTDHARLPIMLVQKEIIFRAYACDIAEGPLKTAEENIQAAHLEKQIKPVLSNGFEHVPDDATAAVLAGMGFYTIRDILEHAYHRLDRLDQIIIQCNTDLHLFRKWISDHGFTILDEVLIQERNHDYAVLSISTMQHPAYTETEIMCGPILMQKGGESYFVYCERRISKIREILSHLKSEDPDAVRLTVEMNLWMNACSK
ncbi:MAG: SAM-dependent methyltransferase [Erysipelotrichia bacterium]|nr:SAM-dependent methyltransferase [Erysipelotrichia bacterium]